MHFAHDFFEEIIGKMDAKWIQNVRRRNDGFHDGVVAINDARRTIASFLLIFNKIVDFRQQMLFFRLFFDFCMNEKANLRKNNICCRKTTFLLKTSNNDAMLLPASFIASGALDDYCAKNQLSEAKISRNPQISIKSIGELWSSYMLPWIRLKWYYQLATYWWGASGRNFCRNFCLPLAPELNFHLWRWFFQVLIKSTIFGNKNNFCCF